MNATREEMIAEAIKRMKMCGMLPDCIRAFKKGEVWFSEGIGYIKGCLYDLSRHQNVLDKIKEVEEENECVVYHVMHNITDFGELWTFCYVSSQKDEWEADRYCIRCESLMCAYCYNETFEYDSEFGDIGFRSCIGGLVRTA